MSAPELSVVLPLSDHRGLALRSVRAWAEQSLPPERYEVVAAGDGRPPRLHRQVRQALRPRDRLLTFPGADEIELYQGGAEAAAGAILLFTESHCVPEEDTALELVRFLDESGARAATLRSGHLARGGLAALEAALGDRATAGCPPERWWSVASLRGLAVRRDEFDRAGGFPVRFGRFAETLLAAELERRGCRAPVARRAVVHHGDCVSGGELEQALRALGRGRARCLGAGIPPRLEALLGGLDSISPADVDSRLARAACRSALRSLGGGRARERARRARWMAGACAPLLPAALGGAGGAWMAGRVLARIAFWRCATRIGRAGFEDRLERFRRAWWTVVRCGEIEGLDRRPLPPLPAPRAPFCFRPGEMGPEHFLGFHGRERDGAGSYRWSSPAGVVRLALPRGSYRLTAHLSRPPGEHALLLALGGRHLSLETLARPGPGSTLETSRVDVPRAGEQHFVVLAEPFRPRSVGLEDTRVLGVAIRGLDFAPC